MARTSVFISHSSADKPFVRKLAERLRDADIHVWLDETALQIGDVIVAKLADAIAQIDFVLAVVSARSSASRWFKKEIDLAATRETVEGHPIVLPIRLDDSEVPSTLRDKLYGDFRQAASFEDEFARLVRRLNVVTGDVVQGDLVPITRLNPALVLLLIDQSSAMAAPFGVTPSHSCAEVVASFANKLLVEILSKCVRLESGRLSVLERFYVAAIAYGGATGHVGSAFNDEFGTGPVMAIGELTRSRSADVISPRSGGDAPMCKAFRLASEIASAWIVAGHEESMPPVVVNFTAGISTDGDPKIPAANLKRLGTKHGKVLLFTACVSHLAAGPLKFPAIAEELPDANARIMFDMSSELTSRMRQALEEAGITTQEAARGVTYQADPLDILNLFTVGTRAAIRKT